MEKVSGKIFFNLTNAYSGQLAFRSGIRTQDCPCHGMMHLEEEWNLKSDNKPIEPFLKIEAIGNKVNYYCRNALEALKAIFHESYIRK